MTVFAESGTASPGTRPLDDAVAALDRALDALAAAADGGLPAAACEQTLTALERHGRRLAAVRLKVLAAAERAKVAQGAGFASTDAWVARRTRTPRAVAARQVALATELAEGHDPTATALDQGLLSAGHAAVIVGAARELPETLSPADRRAVEEAWSQMPDDLTRSSCDVERDGSWRRSSPTRQRSTRTRTSWCARRRRQRGRSAR